MPQPLRPIGFRWFTDQVGAFYVYRTHWEVVSYIEQKDGSFREETARVRFEKLPRARSDDDHGGS